MAELQTPDCESDSLAGPTNTDRINEHENRLVKLEEHVKPSFRDNPVRTGMLLCILTAALSSVGWWVSGVNSSITSLNSNISDIRGDIRAIKQSIADGGNKPVLGEISDPKSPAALKAALSTVVAQAETTKASGKEANPVKLRAISDAVSIALQRYPSLPEAWSAASALVSLRSEDTSKLVVSAMIAAIPPPPSVITQDCLQTNMTYYDTSPPAPGVIEQAHEHIILHDCKMNLGDIGAYKRSNLNKHLTELSKRGPLILELTLYRVKVEYDGGPLIPAQAIIFLGCSFDFGVQGVPPPEGRRMIQAILNEEPSATGLRVDLSQG